MTAKTNSLVYSILPTTEIRNILIVKQHNQLGDMLCTYPIFVALKKKFPSARLTLVASPENSNIINPESDNYIDNLIIYNKHSIGSLIKFFGLLTKRKYEIGIVPSTVSFSHTSHLINFVAGSKVRVGVMEADGRKNRFSKYLNLANKFNWEDRRLHQTEMMIEIVQQIGCSLTREEISRIELQLSKEEVDFAQDFVKTNFAYKTTPIFAFFCGAGKPQNRWEVENFKQLIAMLHKKYKPQILIVFGTTDIELTKELFHKVSSTYDKVVKLQEKNIRKVAAVLKHCNLFVSNDTGIMHAAAFVGAPVVGLFGPTSGYEWGPVNKRGAFVQSPSENINDLTPIAVYKFIENFLEREK